MTRLSIAHRWADWIVFFAGILWILWDMPFVILVLPTDFDYYYKAAMGLAAGENIYYNWMAESVREGIGSWYLYPPYFAAVLAPLTYLSTLSAKCVFALVSILSLIGIDLLLVHFRKQQFPPLRRVDLLIHCLVFFAIPTRLVTGSLQVEGMLFFLFLFMLYFLLQGKSFWKTGIAFVPGVLVKLWPGPYLLTLFFVLGKKAIYIPALLSVIVIALFTLIFGLQPQWDFFCKILPVLTDYADPYKDNQSLSLFLIHICPIPDSLIRGLRWGILLSYVLAAYIHRNALRGGMPRAILINAGLFLCVSLLVTPTAWTAAHIRLLFPMVMACGFFMMDERPKKWLLLLTFLSVICYAYPQDLGKNVLPMWIVRYPILYATLLQYGVFAWLVFVERAKNTSTNLTKR